MQEESDMKYSKQRNKILVNIEFFALQIYPSNVQVKSRLSDTVKWRECCQQTCLARKVKRISTATKTSILQDPLTTLSQILRKKDVIKLQVWSWCLHLNSSSFKIKSNYIFFYVPSSLTIPREVVHGLTCCAYQDPWRLKSLI